MKKKKKFNSEPFDWIIITYFFHIDKGKMIIYTIIEEKRLREFLIMKSVNGDDSIFCILITKAESSKMNVV